MIKGSKLGLIKHYCYLFNSTPWKLEPQPNFFRLEFWYWCFFVCTPHIKNFIGLLSNKRGSQVLVHQKMEGICCKWGKVTVNHFLEEINKSHSFDKWVWPLIDMIFCQDPSMSFKGFENTTFVNTWIYIRLKSLKIFWFGI